MLFFKRYALLQVLLCIVHVSSASEGINQLEKRGKALFFQQASCWVCHGKNAEGIIGPSLQYGPSPTTIQQKLTTVPQMDGINPELQLNFYSSNA